MFDGAEIAAGGVARVLRRHPAADVFLRETIQMRGDLIVEVGVTAALVDEAADTGAEFAKCGHVEQSLIALPVESEAGVR